MLAHGIKVLARVTQRQRWGYQRVVRRARWGRPHYNYFRDYDPATGRYVESDPIGLDGGSYSPYAYAAGNPIGQVDPLGLASAADEMRAMGPMPPPVGAVRPETKAYICKLIDSCQGDLKCVFRRTNTQRKSNMPSSWPNPVWREAENWAYAAGWNSWETLGETSSLGVMSWQITKYIPGNKGTPPSMDAYMAGMEGLLHQGNSPADLKKWCNGCSK